MSVNRRQAARTLGVLALTTGLLLLVMAVARWQGVPDLNAPRVTIAPPMESPEPTPSMTEEPPQPPLNEQFVPDEQLTTIVTSILVIVMVIFGILLLRWLIRLAAQMIRHRRPPLRDGVEALPVALGAPASAEAIAEAVRTGIAGALLRIERGGAPSDAIIAAWVGLEESAAEAGLTRASSETPAEFTVRLIARRGTVADEAGTLLRLYERVRFGGYEAQEPDRVRAREVLQRIEAAWR